MYVTHDQTEAMALGDRLCVLNQGKIMQVDTPLNIYHNPVNQFVAQFIGSPPINIFHGTLQTKNEQPQLQVSDKSYTLSHEKAQLIKQNKPTWHNQQVSIGIRADDIVLVEDEHYHNTIIFNGEIKYIENLGPDVFCYFKINTSEQLQLARITHEQALKLVNRHALFALNMEKIHIFDAESQLNLTIEHQLN